MKLNFKIILFFCLFFTKIYSREIIVINYNNSSNKQNLKILKNALINQLGLPSQFLTFNKLHKGLCDLKEKKVVVGICLTKDDIKIFYLNKKLYKRSIKKIIDQHLITKI